MHKKKQKNSGPSAQLLASGEVLHGVYWLQPDGNDMFKVKGFSNCNVLLYLFDVRTMGDPSVADKLRFLVETFFFC